MTEDRLHLELIDELEKDKLIRFSNALGSITDLKGLATLLTDAIPELTVFDYFLLFMYQHDQNMIVGMGPSKRAHLVQNDDGLLSLFSEEVGIGLSEFKDLLKTIQSNKQAELNDADIADLMQRLTGKGKKEINYLTRLMRMNTCAIIPISILEGRPQTETVVGLLIATTPKERLEKSDRYKISLIAQQLGVILVNELNQRRLHRELETRENNQKLLEAFNRATLDVQKSFDEESMFNSISESLKQSGIGLMAIHRDPVTQDVAIKHLNSSKSMHSAIRQAVSLDMGDVRVKAKSLPRINEAFGSPKPIFMDDIRDVIKDVIKALGMARHMKKLQNLFPIEKCILCPLIVNGRCDTVLVVSKADLLPKDMLFVEVFGLHISNALERIITQKVSQEKSQLIRLMNDMATSFNKALTLDRIFDLLRNEIPKIFKFDHIGLLLFEKDIHNAINHTISDPSGKIGASTTKVTFEDSELEELSDLSELRVGKGDPAKDESPEAKAFGRSKVLTWVVLPLRIEGRFLGLLTLGIQNHAPIDENVFNMISSMKEPLSTALFNSGILSEERRRTEQLRVVSLVSKFSNTVGTEGSMCREVMRLLANTFGYKGLHMIKYDPVEHIFHHLHSSDPEEDKRLKGHQQSADKGVLGRALREKRTVLVANSKEDPDYIECIDGRLSELIVPIFCDGEVEMFISSQSAEPNAFDEKDILTLETVSNEISSLLRALRHKRLEAERLEHLSAINELGRTLLPLGEKDKILTAAANLMESKLSYRRIRVFLMDPRTKGLVLKAVAGLSTNANQDQSKTKTKVGQQVPLGAGAVGLAASKGATTLSQTATPKAEARTTKQGVPVAGALLCSPFKVKDEVVGVIGVEAQEGKSLDEWDQLALETMAREIGKALEMAQAMEETKRRSRLLELVNDLSLNMSKDLNKKGIMERFTEEFQKSRNYLDVAVFLLNKEKNLLVKQAQSGDYKGRSPPDYSQRIDEGLFGVCILKKETLVVNDVTQNKQFKARPWVKTKSEMICPIKVGDEVIGIINVESDRFNAFDDWDRLTVETASMSLAMTLQNSILYEEEQKRSEQLRVLSEFSTKVLKAKNIDVLFQDVVDTLEKRFRFHSVCIFVEDPRKWPLSVLKISATSGAYKDLATLGSEIKSDEGLIGACFTSGKPIICNDTTQDKRFIPEPRAGSLSEICFPLIVSGRVQGVLNVESKSKGAFTQWESIALETIAELLSQAIQNLSQVDELTRRSKDISGVMEIEKGLTSELETNTILELAAKLIHKELGYPSVELYLLDEEGYELELRANSPSNERKKGPHQGFRHSKDTGIIGQVFKHHSISVVNDTRRFERYFDGLGKVVRSAVASPIVIGKEIVGVLNVESDEPNVFSDWDRLVINVMSDLLSGALDRAKRYTVQHERENLFTMAYDAGNILNKATSVEELMRMSSEVIREKLRFFQVEMFSAEVNESGTLDLVLQAASGGLKRKVTVGSRTPAEKGLAGWCVSNKQDALVNDTTLDSRCKDEMTGEVKSELVVLMTTEKETFGAVDVKSKHFDAFSARDHESLKTIVRQIENLLWHFRPKVQN